MRKIFTIISMILTALTLTPLTCLAGDNYINELSKYAVWKQNKRIKVWVQESPYSQGVYNAFREWMIAGGGCIKFLDATSEKNADIRVYFVERLSGNKAGVTHHRSIGKYMVSADVTIGYKDLHQERILSQDEVYAVAVHEIGHALGIMGHSSNRNDIMYPNTNVVGIHASARDFNTIREFYCSGKYN